MTRDRYRFLALTGWGALCFSSGLYGDVSLRDPVALLLFAGMLGGWLALLFWDGPRGS